jgi:NAD(P)-dependent dehydrogenase (short-subunit alcohol dehydrogenase family)
MAMSDGSDGRVALITGAGRGIGRELAGRLARLGWDVGLIARSADELTITAGEVRSAGRREHTFVGDVSRPGDVEAVCAGVEEHLGPVHALINNAAVAGEHARTFRSDPDEWWHAMEINLLGPFMLSRRLIPGMIERGGGYVININSLDCSRSADAGSPVYSVSKTALKRLTEIQAAELAGTGVIAIDLSPGMVRTAMGGARPDADLMPLDAWLPPSFAADKVEQIVSGRYDALHGRFVHAMDDLDVVMATVARLPEARLLRLLPAGDDDPMLSYGAKTSHQEGR